MTVQEQTREHRVVSEQEWIDARKALLLKEKELTRQRDEITRLRQDLPWVKVEKEYTFETPEGKKTLSELFEGRSQLLIYHFMFAPDWEEGCPGCSFISDHVDGALPHLEHHDVTYTAVSRAPLATLEAYKKRMGWKFPWVSAGEGDFNYDFHASYRREDLDRGPVFHNFTEQKLQGEDQPGLSAFYKAADGTIYHTYSMYERGGDILINTYNFLDMAPLGRNEKSAMDWMKRHDEYEGDRQ
jgi:predicted dithiol-disulfide oxidoreductase (DUF899 family)